MPLHATQATAQAGDLHLLRAYKVSKRQDDDISAVCLVLRVAVQGGIVTEATIGAGGVAATPVRATQAEAALRGQPWNAATAQAAAAALQAQFSPISDMRQRRLPPPAAGQPGHALWNESQGHRATTLEQIAVEVLP